MTVAKAQDVRHQGFGERVRALRLRYGATQRQLADLSTVSVRAIRDIETGRAQHPRSDTIRLIADGLGLEGRSRTDFEALARTPDADTDPFAGPPTVLDGTIGREGDVTLLRETLAAQDHRLVTVVGVGGVGKSRLAADATTQLHGSGAVRVCWCSCADGVDEPAPAIEAATWGGQGRHLVVLDGLVPDEAVTTRLLSLLDASPSLQVLVTAREPLDVRGERIFPLEPLALPAGNEGPTEMAQCPALALLVRDARQLRPGFDPGPVELEVLAEVCRRLDGIPGALTAAAGLLLALDPQTLLDEICADPCAVVDADLVDGALPTELPDRALLEAVLDVDGSWSIREIAARTGASLMACHRMVRRLVVRGAVASTAVRGEPRFRLLTLVRASYRPGRHLYTAAP